MPVRTFPLGKWITLKRIAVTKYNSPYSRAIEQLEPNTIINTTQAQNCRLKINEPVTGWIDAKIGKKRTCVPYFPIEESPPPQIRYQKYLVCFPKFIFSPKPHFFVFFISKPRTIIRRSKERATGRTLRQ